MDKYEHVRAELRAALSSPMRWLANLGAWPLALPLVRRIVGGTASDSPRAAPPFEERQIPGPAGAPTVRVFVVNAKPAAAPRAAVLHIHGGGYIFGKALQRVAMAQRIAAQHDSVVVVVDYRLAPETRFPGSLEDNYAALTWMHDNAAALGIDPHRIAVLGESAGGGHAAMLTIAARDRSTYAIAAQILIYPMLDDRTGSTRQVPAHMGQYFWTRKLNRFGWSSLLGMPAGSPQVPDGAVPARVADLVGLPPTFIGVGSIDLFMEEDIEYGRRL